MHKNIILGILTAIVFSFLSATAFSETSSFDPENMKKYNPDGEKYDFVKSYIAALTYIKANAERNEKYAVFSFEEMSQVETGRALMDNLIQENANLRVARNLLKKYKTADNGLILNVVDIFTAFCDEQISLNNQERALLDKLYRAQIDENVDAFNKKNFAAEQLRLISLRRESWKDVLRASMYIPKILVSDEQNEKGEFVWLAITEEEKMKLLLKLDQFYGPQYSGELREGQTFLQGAVVVIREILEDSKWKTLPKS